MKLKHIIQLSDIQQFFILILLCQVVFWYFGSPGPTLLQGAEQSLFTSVRTIIVSVIFLFIIPMSWLKFKKWNFQKLGFSIGDNFFGISIAVLSSLLIVPILFFATKDVSIQVTYPWVGEWAGVSVSNLVTWILLYSIYYLCYEFFYRSFILKAGEQFFTPQICMLLQVAFSVMVHVGKPLPETLAAIPAGFLFGWLALRTKSLLYPILLHLVIGATTDIFSLYHQDLLLFLKS